MHVLTVPALLMCAAAAGAVGWTANRLSTGAGGPLLILPWASLAALAAGTNRTRLLLAGLP